MEERRRWPSCVYKCTAAPGQRETAARTEGTWLRENRGRSKSPRSENLPETQQLGSTFSSIAQFHKWAWPNSPVGKKQKSYSFLSLVYTVNPRCVQSKVRVMSDMTITSAGSGIMRNSCEEITGWTEMRKRFVSSRPPRLTPPPPRKELPSTRRRCTRTATEEEVHWESHWGGGALGEPLGRRCTRTATEEEVHWESHWGGGALGQPLMRRCTGRATGEEVH